MIIPKHTRFFFLSQSGLQAWYSRKRNIEEKEFCSNLDILISSKHQAAALTWAQWAEERRGVLAQGRACSGFDSVLPANIGELPTRRLSRPAPDINVQWVPAGTLSVMLYQSVLPVSYALALSFICQLCFTTTLSTHWQSPCHEMRRREGPAESAGWVVVVGRLTPPSPFSSL